MNCVKFKNQWFNIIDQGGISYTDVNLKLIVLANNYSIEDIIIFLKPVPEIIEIYEENRETKIGEFIGYTTLNSLTYSFNQVYGLDLIADLIEISFIKPGLEKRVDANEAQTFYTAMMTDTLLEE